MSQTLSDSPAQARDSGSPADPITVPSNGSKRRRMLLVLLVIALLGGAGGTAYWLHARQFESTDDAFIEGHAVLVSPKVSGQVLALLVTDNQTVKQGDVLVQIDPRDYEAHLKQAQGALQAAQAQAQAAQTNLRLTEVTAPADLRLAQAGVEAAQAALGASQAQVRMTQSQQTQALASVESAKATVAQSQADAQAAQAEAKRTADDLARYRTLVKSNNATTQELDNAQAAATSAAARFEAAQKKVAVSQAEVTVSQAAAKTAAETVTQAQAQAQQAQSGIAQANAKLAQAEPFAQRIAYARSQAQAADALVAQLQAAVAASSLQLEYCTIRAPQNGYVTRRTVEQGSYLQPGQPMLAIVDPRVWVVANFKETQLERMKPGQAVSVSVDALGGLELPARVDSLMAGTGARFSLLPPENATGNYVKVVQRVPVKIVFDEPVERYKFALGLSVEPSVRVR